MGHSVTRLPPLLDVELDVVVGIAVVWLRNVNPLSREMRTSASTDNLRNYRDVFLSPNETDEEQSAYTFQLHFDD